MNPITIDGSRCCLRCQSCRTMQAVLNCHSVSMNTFSAPDLLQGLCQPASQMRVQRFAIREDTLSLYCRVWKWIGGDGSGVSTPVHPKKKTLFLIEKYIEDAKQDEKRVPDLLEAIIQPTGLVKEELRQILLKITQLGSKITKIKSQITKIKVSKFWILEIRSFRAAGQCQPSHQ